MKLNVQTTVTFKEDDLKLLITEYCAKEYKRKVKSMHFNVAQGFEDRPCGGSYPTFNGVEVILGDSIDKSIGGCDMRDSLIYPEGTR